MMMPSETSLVGYDATETTTTMIPRIDVTTSEYITNIATTHCDFHVTIWIDDGRGCYHYKSDVVLMRRPHMHHVMRRTRPSNFLKEHKILTEE